MKFLLGAIAIVLSADNSASALKLHHKGKAGFVDDIVKGLAELDKQEEAEAKAGKKDDVKEK